MYEKIPISRMGKEEWLALRKTGIGGSDAGAVCGLNPYSSPMEVFYDKTGSGVEVLDSEAIRQGHDLEDYVARRFMESTGLKVRRSNYMYRSVEYPFMIADIDRLVAGGGAGLECKTASAYSADKWKDGNIPAHYVLQCYHYMAVTGKRSWYIAVAILGREFLYHKLEWDDGLVSGLVEAEKHFWENHIMPGILPPPDGSKACDGVLAQHYPAARKGSAIELVGFDEKLDRRAKILKQIEELTREQGRIDQEIKLFMKDNESASNGKYRISWSNISTTRLDTKLLKKEMPGIYQDYAKASSSRKFQVKAA